MGQRGSMKHDLARQFGWEIAAINVHLQEIRNLRARAVGVSGPQWMILMALSELDQGEGVPVKVVSKMLHVDRWRPPRDHAHVAGG